MTPTERYVTMLQYYSQSVTKSVVGSVKKLRVLSKYLYPAPLKSSNGFFTLRQTHFFTCDQYSQDEYYCSMKPHSYSTENKEERGWVARMSTETAQLLAEIPLFSAMDDEERRELRTIMRERSFSIFVLISQNRQAAKDRIKADLDYQVNVKTELELSAMAQHIRDIEQKLHHIHHDVLQARGGR